MSRRPRSSPKPAPDAVPGEPADADDGFLDGVNEDKGHLQENLELVGDRIGATAR